MIAMDTKVKAASVPILTRWANVVKSTKPAMHAATNPVNHVFLKGVLYFL
jgi:hypothetical protein